MVEAEKRVREAEEKLKEQPDNQFWKEIKHFDLKNLEKLQRIHTNFLQKKMTDEDRNDWHKLQKIYLKKLF